VDAPRLLALDLDGTLLRSDASLSDRTRRALKAVTAAGVELVVVTARPPRYVTPLANQLGLEGVALCANGAIELDLGTGTWTATRPLPLAVAVSTVDALAEMVTPIGFGIETGDRVVHEPGFVPGDTPDARFTVPDLATMFELGRPIVKLLARSPTHDADELLGAAVVVLGDDVEATHSGGRGLLEISAAGVSKMDSLERLCAQRGIAAAQVMAFGDAPNDLAMLRWAGTGYAVANAHPAVLDAVTRHTASNDEDGVAVILETLVTPIKGSGRSGRRSGPVRWGR
jgi:Cof subfamily protein (haloacid dehalogenase superfamily)